MKISELIKRLQQAPNQDAEVSAFAWDGTPDNLPLNTVILFPDGEVVLTDKASWPADDDGKELR